jgi:mono/diheme cytochrome c family protein
MRKAFRVKSACLALLGCLSFGPSAADEADAIQGEHLARRWCQPCHIVAPDQRMAGTDAMPFATIARSTDFDAGRLALFLLAPHPKMPDMDLTRAEATDLAAYIKTLRE